jgi:hypothetical protein
MSIPRTLCAIALSTLLGAAACDSSSGLDEDGGVLEGTVTVQSGGDVGPSPHLLLYVSQQDLQARENGIFVPLSGPGPVIEFRVQKLVPNTYFVEACVEAGCGTYQQATGQPTAVHIRTGETTTIAIALTL